MIELQETTGYTVSAWHSEVENNDILDTRSADRINDRTTRDYRTYSLSQAL